MARPGLRKINQYSEDFKATAVGLSNLPGVLIQVRGLVLDRRDGNRCDESQRRMPNNPFNPIAAKTRLRVNGTLYEKGMKIRVN